MAYPVEKFLELNRKYNQLKADFNLILEERDEWRNKAFELEDRVKKLEQEKQELLDEQWL